MEGTSHILFSLQDASGGAVGVWCGVVSVWGDDDDVVYQ